MSFELKTQINPEGEEKEVIEESIIKTRTTVTVWNKKQIQNTIIDLTEQIVEIESRITVLTEQLARFKK